ncbi:putative malate dehydrogenase 1B isoform X2 [Caretta caretta]|uniref:putative malate dehydrogenase 1B isoform X2 n=1 Tax=Caretta caretta TaxID=8467 RepID=UPI003F4BDDFC
MAKFVLAGKADCPYFVKAELLADYLQINLPNFKIHKITQHPDKWEQWLHDICEKNGWKHKRSPIVWRELLDRGGKGLLLGGFNDFMEYAQHYYGITSDMLSEQMLRIAEENLQTHIEIEKEEEYIKSLIKPLQIWISSASAPACYNLIPLLANGEVFGMATEVSIHLLDSSHYKEILHGIVMEAQDLAFPLLRSVSMHTELEDAFVQADIVILLDDLLLQHEIPSLEDCIRQVTEQCKVYGSLIEKNANSSVKVIVSGKTFVNLKALMIMTFAPSIDGQNIIAMAMFLESAAKAMLARKLNMNSAGVKDVIVWGNISGNNYIDLSKAKVYRYDSAIWGPPNFSRRLLDMIYDGNWVRSEFVSVLSSLEHHCLGMSPAHVIATVLRYWYQDSPPGEIVSMGILSEGQFCIPEGIIFSMPVRFQDGSWEVITETEIDEETQETLKHLAHDLIQEKQVALGEIPEMRPYKETAFNGFNLLALLEEENFQTSPKARRAHLHRSPYRAHHHRSPRITEELQHGPNGSQDLCITLDPVSPESTQGGLPDPEGREGTSAAYVSPSQRLAKIRRRKKHTRDEIFSDLMLPSHTDRAQQNMWQQTISECRKTQYDHEERWRAEDDLDTLSNGLLQPETQEGEKVQTTTDEPEAPPNELLQSEMLEEEKVQVPIDDPETSSEGLNQSETSLSNAENNENP